MTDSARISVTLFHASKVAGLDQLDPAASDDSNMFGPAIYATKDRKTAECQHRTIAAIYKIRASGAHNGIIELNQAFNFQSDLGKKAIETVNRRYRLSAQANEGQPVRNWLYHAAAELAERGVAYPTRTLINRALADEGIWLLRGVADGIEATYPQDNGIQWAIIRAENTHIEEEQPHHLTTLELA